jgi:hypothetical protein
MQPKHKAKSPYQKYGKKPFRYSPSLVAWREAVKAGKPNVAAEHDRAWREQMRRESNAMIAAA